MDLKTAVKISVNETNNIIIVECRGGAYGAIPKSENNDELISNPYKTLLFSKGFSNFTNIKFSENDYQKIIENKIPYDKDLLDRASYINEIRYFIYRQK